MGGGLVVGGVDGIATIGRKRRKHSRGIVFIAVVLVQPENQKLETSHKQCLTTILGNWMFKCIDFSLNSGGVLEQMLLEFDARACYF